MADGVGAPVAPLPKRLLVPVLATLLPLLLMAVLGHYWLTREATVRTDMRLAAENRHVAAVLSQRVTAAHALLVGLAQSPLGSVSGSAPGPAIGAGLWSGWAEVNPADGQLGGGDPQIWQRWQQAAAAERGETLPAPGGATGGLRWLPEAPGATRARILIAVTNTEGRLWLAELSPNYLWSGLAQAESGVTHCVTDSRNRPIHCLADVAATSAHANATAGATPALRRSLYWPVEWGGSPWMIQSELPPSAAPGSESGLLFRSLALAGAISLVVGCGMAMRQWKRSAQSLGKVMQAADNWVEQDWAARIAVHPTDDFHGLAQSLNHLADRTGQKLKASQVQSAIDREILGGLDIHRVMRLVVDRLQALLPKARVAVLVVEPSHEGQPRWVIHRPGQKPQHAQAGAVPMVLSEDEWAVTLRAAPAALGGPAGSAAADSRPFPVDSPNRLPPWAAKALGVPREWLNLMLWVPVRRHGQALAYLALGSRVELELNDDTKREITDLRDRVAVTLTSAARESALLSRAIHDGLTGLFNRMGLQDSIDALVSQREPFTLVLVDLDRFKEVNDTLGHQAGDELLCAVAGRLRECVSPQARLARPGGDEFVLLLPGTTNEATAAAMAICAELARPFPLRGVQAQIGGSLGLASFPEQAQNRGELLRRADLAMYVSKGEGRGRFSWYAEAMDERIAQRAWMAQELRVAVERAHFILHYQPRVEASDGRVVSAEALLRWPHAERGLISPGDFVPAAEESGLIDQLGAWVLASAFQQMKEWRQAGVPLHRVAVNVSARQLMTPGFTNLVLELMNRYELAPSDIELELTESVFAGDVDAVCHVLDPLRSIGIQLALDDFGTGYSSLSSLYRLPVDVIKIDHSFVRDLGHRPSAEIMARSIVALAKALNKRVVAEGVETVAQRDHLLRLGADELQGYLYGRPLAPAALVKRITELGAADEPPSHGTAPTLRVVART